MGFPTIAGGGRSTTTTTYGGADFTKVQQLLSGINIASTDSTNKPNLNTEMLFKSGKLRYYDLDNSNLITVLTPNLTSDVNVTYPATMQTGASVNTYLFENANQAITNKDINANVNTIYNIADSHIISTAAIAWSKISKSGSKLQDIADVNITGRVNNSSPVWNSSTSKWDMKDLTNPDILLPNKTSSLPTATTTSLPIYRNDLDVNNQRVYVSKLEAGVPVLVRLC